MQQIVNVRVILPRAAARALVEIALGRGDETCALASLKCLVDPAWRDRRAIEPVRGARWVFVISEAETCSGFGGKIEVTLSRNHETSANQSRDVNDSKDANLTKRLLKINHRTYWQYRHTQVYNVAWIRSIVTQDLYKAKSRIHAHQQAQTNVCFVSFSCL